MKNCVAKIADKFHAPMELAGLFVKRSCMKAIGNISPKAEPLMRERISRNYAKAAGIRFERGDYDKGDFIKAARLLRKAMERRKDGTYFLSHETAALVMNLASTKKMQPDSAIGLLCMAEAQASGADRKAIAEKISVLAIYEAIMYVGAEEMATRYLHPDQMGLTEDIIIGISKAEDTFATAIKYAPEWKDDFIHLMVGAYLECVWYNLQSHAYDRAEYNLENAAKYARGSAAGWNAVAEGYLALATSPSCSDKAKANALARAIELAPLREAEFLDEAASAYSSFEPDGADGPF